MAGRSDVPPPVHDACGRDVDGLLVRDRTFHPSAGLPRAVDTDANAEVPPTPRSARGRSGVHRLADWARSVRMLRHVFGRWREGTARVEDRWHRIKTEALIVPRMVTSRDDAHLYVPLAYGQVRRVLGALRPGPNDVIADVTMAAMLERLRASIDENPRRVRIAYVNPTAESELLRCGWLRRTATTRSATYRHGLWAFGFAGTSVAGLDRPTITVDYSISTGFNGDAVKGSLSTADRPDPHRGARRVPPDVRVALLRNPGLRSSSATTSTTRTATPTTAPSRICSAPSVPSPKSCARPTANSSAGSIGTGTRSQRSRRADSQSSRGNDDLRAEVRASLDHRGARTRVGRSLELLDDAGNASTEAPEGVFQ